MIYPVQFKLNNFQYIHPVNRKNTENTFQSLKCDTITFTSRQDLLQKNSKEITSIVKDAIKNINYIGEGRSGVVFRIPDTDYCIKLDKKRPNIKSSEKWITNVDEADKVNHIAAIGLKSRAIIMKFIEGEPLTESFLPAMYNLPIESFRNTLIQLDRARKQQMYFDYALQNVLFNKSDNSMTIIDFIKLKNIPEKDYGISNKLFTCLQTEDYDDISKGLNLMLGKKILNTICNELRFQKTPSFDITKSDLHELIRLIFNTQECWGERYQTIQKSFAQIFEGEDKFIAGQIIPEKVRKEAQKLSELVQNNL